MQRKAILVLGMHRSGTSALAGMLTKIGVAGPSRPMAANEYNAKGYFESFVVCETMDRLLALAGSAWDDWRPLDLQAIPTDKLAAAKAELAAVARDEFGAAPCFVLKDPRNARAVPLWLDILRDMQVEPYAIISVRSPQAVALSLARRDRMPGDKAALLWIRHVLDAERFTRGMPRAFVAFDELVGTPVAALDRLARIVGLEWPVPPRDAADALRSFVEKRLVHHAPEEAAPAGAAASARWYEPLTTLLAPSILPEPQALDTAALDALAERFADETAPFAHYFGAAESALRGKDGTIGQLQQQLHRSQWALGAIAASEARPGGPSLGDIVDEAMRSQGQRLDSLERQGKALEDRLEALEERDAADDLPEPKRQAS